MKRTKMMDLMQRYITGQVTEQERIKIEAWLDVKKTDEGTDMVLDPEDEEKLFRTITANIDNVEEIKAFRPARGKVRTLFANRWIQIAATLLILAVASYSIRIVIAKNAVHETITGANTEKVILSDGTIVWLQKESELTYVKNNGIRQASLKGEGLFEVAKDPSTPFIISCGTLKVKVIGTSFNLKARGEDIELKVLTGKVTLASTTDSATIDVAPNEMAVYNHNAGLEKTSMNMDEVNAVTAGTEYDMEFKNTTLEKVVERIEKKFDTQVVLENALASQCRITADFTDHSLKSTMDMITELLEVDYNIEKSIVTITGNGCD